MVQTIRNSKYGYSIPLLYCFRYCFFFLLEGLLRLLNYGESYPLFIEDENSALYFKQNTEFAKRYFNNLDEVPHSAYDVFLKEKLPRTFRVFVLGASSAAGFPYNGGATFSRQLHKKLQLMYPSIHVEIVNTAIAAVNSYTLNDIASEIKEMEPDAVLIYAGHNEYYGAYGIASTYKMGSNPRFVRFYLKITKLKTVQLIRNLLGGMTSEPVKSGTMMNQVVGQASVEFNSEEYHLGLKQFKGNMLSVIEKFQKSDITVLISTIVSNEKDHIPFDFLSSKSNKKNEILEVIDQGIEIKMRELGEKMLEENPSSSIGHYLLGKATLSQNTDQARDLFQKAKDFDKVRFRAPSEINTIIKELAAESGVILVDTELGMRRREVDGIIGKEFITEHLHPNISGYELISDVFARSISDHLLDEKALLLDDSTYFVERPYTAIDSVQAHYLLERLLLSWPFTPTDESINYDPIDSLIPKTFYEQIAKDIHVGRKYWVQGLEEAFVYIRDSVEENKIDMIRISNALRQEYPYIPETKERLAWARWYNGDTIGFQNIINLLIRETNEVRFLMPAVNYFLQHEDYERANQMAELMNTANDELRLIYAATTDILNLDKMLPPGAVEYERGVGALIYLKKYDKAEEWLNEISGKGLMDLKQQATLRKILNEHRSKTPN